MKGRPQTAIKARDKLGGGRLDVGAHDSRAQPARLYHRRPCPVLCHVPVPVPVPVECLHNLHPMVLQVRQRFHACPCNTPPAVWRPANTSAYKACLLFAASDAAATARLQSARKLSLLLDLDHTLVHATAAPAAASVAGEWPNNYDVTQRSENSKSIFAHARSLQD